MLDRFAQLRESLRRPADERSMKEKLVIAAGLKAVEQAVLVITRLGATLILTRLLAPETYGVFVVIITLQVMTNMLTDFGPRSLILSMREEERVDLRFLHTCWALQLLRGLVLFILFLLIAAAIAGAQAAGIVAPDSAYAAEDLPAAFAVLGLAVVIQGLETMNQYLHERDLRLVRLAAVRIGYAVATPTLMILFALVTPTVWCMVLASIVSMTLKVVALELLMIGPRMRFLIDRAHWREILSHLRWILSASGLWAFGREADNLILGFFLPAPFLGVYFIARQIVSMPLSFVLDFANSTGMQVFNQLLSYGDKAALKRNYYRYRLPIDAVCYLLAGIFIAAGPAIVALLYDPRYQAAGEIIRILSLTLPVAGIVLLNSGFLAQRRFWVGTLVTGLDTATMVTGLLLALAVLESPVVAFFVVALYRVPSSAALIWLGLREGWVTLWREFRMAPLIAVGLALGWAGGEVIYALGFV